MPEIRIVMALAWKLGKSFTRDKLAPRIKYGAKLVTNKTCNG
jgi:hypothetical protein